MICNLYAPTLTLAPGRFLENVGALRSSYEHTIAATVGFESCTIQRIVTLEQAQAYTDLLLAPLIVYGPDADVCWEGFLNSVEIRDGERTRSVSLEALQNRIRVTYTTVLQTPGTTAAVSDADSIARYGTHDGVVTAGNSIAAEALATANQALNERSTPRAKPASSASFSASPSGSGVQLTLGFAGWYTTLGWVVLTRNDTADETTTTQVGTLIGTSAPGIGAINPFLDPSTANIASSGVTGTRKIEANTTYRAAIEARLGRGTSGNERLAWGVYEGRRLHVATWAGATPSAITYRLQRASGEILDSRNTVIAPWRVRPNAMVEELQFLDPTPAIGAEAASRYFAERVIYSDTGQSRTITFEPAASGSLDARLMRLAG